MVIRKEKTVRKPSKGALDLDKGNELVAAIYEKNITSQPYKIVKDNT